MKTRAEIVQYARSVDMSKPALVGALDNFLYERAEALKERPEARAEWLLAWAVNTYAQAMRCLDEACQEDERRAANTRSIIFSGSRFDEPSKFCGPAFSRTVDRTATVVAAQETLRRVLEMYEAMAVDVIRRTAQ